MAFADLNWLAVLLRTMIYLATVAMAGGVLVRATLRMAPANQAIDWQIGIGIVILLVCEPLRYVAFQLSIAQGDWAIAFDPTMRWMGIETPLGQAGGLRLIGASIVALGFIWRPLAVAGALIAIGSFLIEGHTVSSENRLLLAALLFVHLAIAHWWLGALLPLKALLRNSHDRGIAETFEDFGRKAMYGVLLLTAAGGTVLGILTNWQIDPTSTYQQGFALKLTAFVSILAIAALNKFRWTPLLASNPQAGKRGLATSINVEVAVAGAILGLTAIATSFAPTEH